MGKAMQTFFYKKKEEEHLLELKIEEKHWI